MLNLFDSHVHSDNSPDGNHSVTFLAERAIEAGLMGVAVTDHCEVDQYQEDNFELRILQSVFETKKAQLLFGGRVNLSAGLELGQPVRDPIIARRVLELQSLDFVLASVHAVKEKDFFYLDYTKMPQEEQTVLIEDYLQEIYDTVLWGGFDVLAHLSYPLRYMIRDGVDYDFNQHKKIIDAILKALIREGKGLELNTSGYYRSHGRPSPERPVLERYRELGGRIVTMGSDAHRAEHMGGGIQEGMQLLLDCGFREFAFYKKRAPRMLELK